VHEYSIVQALVDRVEQEAAARGATRVDRLQVQIGDLSGVDPGLLTTAYLTYREGTVCHDADLEIVQVAARWICRACGCEVAARGILRCDTCGGSARLLAGDEILLERIEMEVG
jgi:hydrogenase nickel incorporation protein HypA/HybF